MIMSIDRPSVSDRENVSLGLKEPIMYNKKVTFSSLVWIVIFAVLAIVPIAAQDDVTVISLAVPEFISGQITDEVFALFEAEHPNVRVHLVSEGTFEFGATAPILEINDYLDRTADYVTKADVLSISPSQLTAEATRAGYFLDMTPLINSDPDLNPDDFYASLYNSYQWDEGFWALPSATDLIGLSYDPEAFDLAGVEYPQTWWTMDDFERALRALAEYDNNGNVTAPAFVDFTGNSTLLILSMLGQGVVDDSVTPNVPNYSDPQLEDLVSRWAELQKDGFIGVLEDEDAEFTPPLALSPSLFTINTGGNDDDIQLALLPNDGAGLIVNGFAISAGTAYPELAYDLIKFLTSTPEVANAYLPTVSTARRSIADIDVSNEFTQLIDVPQDIIDRALETGWSVADARFSQAIDGAIRQMVANDVDIQVALRDAEVAVLDRLQVASDRADDVLIFVDSPEQSAAVSAEDISLRFGMEITSLSGIPNRDIWDDVIADFVANDLQVGEVLLQSPGIFDGIELVNLSEDFDCFYLFSNVVQSASLEHLLSVDPLMASDPNFNVNDYPLSIMSQIQRDNQTWAVPLVIQPIVMGYNPQTLDFAGAPQPYAGWTTVDFENILRTLKVDPEDPAPFASFDLSGAYIFPLIASYGGLPIDYRTSPPTFDYTDEATVNAIRQVLNLAKDGYIKYDSLTNLAVSAFGVDVENSEIPLFTLPVNDFFFDIGASDTFAMVEFPQGQTYTSLLYDLGSAYISKNTLHAEACYRFISKVSEHPELFRGMPARRSMINNPQFVASRSDLAVEFFTHLDSLINQPNAVLFPTGFSNNLETIREYLLYTWLFRAFDRYVNEDADLQQELEEAELFTLAFLQCTEENIEPYSPGDNLFGYFGQYTDCALQVDPSMDGTFLSF
jgi:ABC-type glycerol-3-phosphate transport system substrate-binding protein